MNAKIANFAGKSFDLLSGLITATIIMFVGVYILGPFLFFVLSVIAYGDDFEWKNFDIRWKVTAIFIALYSFLGIINIFVSNFQ